MKEPAISNEIRLFLARYIGSLQQLKVLLVLKSSSAKAWSADEVSRKLHLDVTSVSNRLLNLWSKRLVKVLDGPVRLYRFHPANREEEAVVGAIARLYQKYPSEVARLISAR